MSLEAVNVSISTIHIYGLSEAFYLELLQLFCERDKLEKYRVINYAEFGKVLNMGYTEQARCIKSLEFRGIITTEVIRVCGKNRKAYEINQDLIKQDIEDWSICNKG